MLLQESFHSRQSTSDFLNLEQMNDEGYQTDYRSDDNAIFHGDCQYRSFPTRESDGTASYQNFSRGEHAADGAACCLSSQNHHNTEPRKFSGLFLKHTEYHIGVGI